MTKFLRSVAITPVVGDAITFADTATYTGGTIAWDQVQYGKDVIVPSADGSTITMIPYHAIAKVVVTKSTTTVSDPIDTFCSGEDTDEGGTDEGGTDEGE